MKPLKKVWHTPVLVFARKKPVYVALCYELWRFLQETEVKQRWTWLVHVCVTVTVTEVRRTVGRLNAVPNRYRMTPAVRHSGKEWLIYFFIFSLSYTAFHYVTLLRCFILTAFHTHFFQITQKWVHKMDVIDKEEESNLERFVGRTREDSIELTNKPVSSHVARMTGGSFQFSALCIVSLFQTGLILFLLFHQHQ